MIIITKSLKPELNNFTPRSTCKLPNQWELAIFRQRYLIGWLTCRYVVNGNDKIGFDKYNLVYTINVCTLLLSFKLANLQFVFVLVSQKKNHSPSYLCRFNSVSKFHYTISFLKSHDLPIVLPFCFYIQPDDTGNVFCIRDPLHYTMNKNRKSATAFRF